ncbi:MAG: zinc-binding dehydrogenase, partial [Bacillota bacterium]
ESCKKGQVNMCRNVISVGEDGDGIFAEYYVAKRKLLHKLSPDVDIDVAVFAEPLACVLNGFKRLRFVPGQTVMVLGAGPIGLLFTKLAKAAGASTVVLTEIAPFRIDFARKNSGATRVIDLNSEDIGHILTDINGTPEADVVIDTVGTQFAAAVQYAAYEGTILLFGVNDQVSQTIKQYTITRKELTVVSSYATFNTFPLVEKMLSNDVLDLKPLLTHRVDLEALPEGIEMLRRGEAMKVVVYPHK